MTLLAMSGVLKTYGVERLVDIRTVPRSRCNPQFNDTAMADSMTTAHLEYLPTSGREHAGSP